MIINHNCVTFFSLVLFTQVRSLQSQGFQDPDAEVIGKFGGNVDLIWNFNTGGFSIQRIGFINEHGTYIMSVVPGRPPLPGNGFEDTVKYIDPYGITISNLTMSEDGLYTCEIILTNGKYSNETRLKVYEYLEPIEVLMSLEREDDQLKTGDDVASGESLTVTVQAPENEPAAIDITIQILYDGQINETEICENRNAPTPCIFDYIVLDGKVGQSLEIEACLTHPAISSSSCSNITLSIKDPYTSSVAPDDTSVSTYTPSPTEDKGPDDPGAECKWWCILLIVLPMVIVVIVIICCCWHYKVACFRHKSSAQIDVNQKQETNGFGMENKAY